MSRKHLRLAIARNNLELAQVLIAHGADSNHHLNLDPKHYKNYGFMTAFADACAGASLQIVEYLYSQGTKIERYVPGMTPLVRSVRTPEVSRFLVSKGAPSNIFFPIASGEVPEMKKSLEENPELAKRRTNSVIRFFTMPVNISSLRWPVC